MSLSLHEHDDQFHLPRLGKRLPRIRDDHVVYAIGDVHGRVDLLDALIMQIIKNAAHRRNTVRQTIVFLGDYIDRGPASREVVNILLYGIPDTFETIFLRGNHEEMLLEFVEDPDILDAWKSCGGLQTLESYARIRPEPKASPVSDFEEWERFRRNLPTEHLEFFRDLDLVATFGDYLFVHAGLKPGVAIAKQKRTDLLWIRDEFLNSNANFGKIVVHGHTPSNHIEVRRNRIGIDTGAFATNVLTCLVLQGESQSYIRAESRMVSAA